MFAKNDNYQQIDLFGLSNKLSKKQNKLWDKSREHLFFKEIFSKIDEAPFSCLYSKQKSRPNTPVNQLVGALILKHLNNWTYRDLFTNLNFNMLTRHAIGIQRIDEDVFAEASIFNFQNRVIKHFNKTGIDLINLTFDKLTSSQLKRYDVDTTIQRGDSFLIGSNIVDMSRLHLLVEMIIRVYKVLSSADKNKVQELLQNYIDDKSLSYVYKIKREDLPREYSKLAEVYQNILSILGTKYEDEEVYQLFIRVNNEHFEQDLKGNTGAVKKMNSGILFHPDDPEATYRKKQNIHSKGYVGHISETSNPNNEIDLITDVKVEQNNIGDAEILENRLPKMIDKTPNLKEYFADGMYGSPGVDIILDDNNIRLYQKAIRGQKSKGDIKIIEDGTDLWVTCGGGQKIKPYLTNRKKTIQKERLEEGAKSDLRWGVAFDEKICSSCPLAGKCNTVKSGGKRTNKTRKFYFTNKKILAQRRAQNMAHLEGNKIHTRANVEATVKENKRGIKNGKVRVRRWIRVSFHVVLTAIAVNFTRIHSKITKKITKSFSQRYLYITTAEMNNDYWAA